MHLTCMNCKRRVPVLDGLCTCSCGALYDIQLFDDHHNRLQPPLCRVWSKGGWTTVQAGKIGL